MRELSEVVREKLNNPEIIKGMAEHLVRNFGREIQHNGRFDTDDLELMFIDMPSRYLLLRGWIDNFKNITNREIYSLEIDWADKGYSWDLNDLTHPTCSKNSKKVYWWMIPKNESGKIFTFEKGEWQNYLAKCYLSSLSMGELKSKKHNLLL